MAEKISLQIEVEADRAKMSLGELEAGFDGLKEKLKATSRGTEEGRKEFKKLSTEMAQTSAAIKNIELGFEGLDNEQIASELGSVSGAIGDVTAAFILMGGESESMEAMAANIQTAIGVSMGLKGAIEGVSSGMKLYNNLLKQGKVAVIAKSIAEKAAAAGTWLMTAAQTAFNAVMALNPLGIIIIGLGLAVAAIVYFKDAIWNLIKIAFWPWIAAIDLIIDGLQALGLVESDAAKATRKAEKDKADAVKKASKEKIAEYKKQIKELKKLQEAHKKLSDEVIGDMEFEVNMLKAKGENVVKAEWDLVREKKKIANESHKLIYAELVAERDRLREFKKLKGYVLKAELDHLDDLVKANTEAFNKTKEADRDIELYRAAHNKGVQDNRDAAAKEGSDKRREQRAKDSEEERAAQLADDEWELALYEKFMADEKELKAIRLEDERLLDLQKLSDYDAFIQESKEIENQAHLDTLAKIEEEAKAKKEARDKMFADSTAVIGALSALNKAATDTALLNAAGDEAKKEKIRKASFEREKKLNVAMALINGAQAVLAGFAQGGLPMAIVAGVTAAAQLASILATTYTGGGAGAPAISSQAPSPGGAGAGGGGAQINPVSNTSTILGGNTNVTVVETDITNTQNNVNVIEESATF